MAEEKRFVYDCWFSDYWEESEAKEIVSHNVVEAAWQFVRKHGDKPEIPRLKYKENEDEEEFDINVKNQLGEIFQVTVTQRVEVSYHTYEQPKPLKRETPN